MSSPIFIILQRLRYPLILLISVYAILILGFTLIPGVDDQGNPWRMSFFHAFYFVSYMATTIGFGEIPYTFTNAQRLWASFGIYLSVISWLYSIGSLLTTLKDPAFQRVLTESSFSRKVRKLQTPFYLICGYGDTGCLLTRALSNIGVQSVVLDIEQARIDALAIEEQDIDIPAICANAIFPENLVLAGLEHPKCVGVLALTHVNRVNLKIAITAKLLNKPVTVISRADTNKVMANMASFDTDYIINPFEMFAKRLALAIRSPCAYLIYDWFTNPHHSLYDEPPNIPKGLWLLCGYGRFGKAIARHLEYEGLQTIIIEAEPNITEAPKNCIIGEGTEAVTLKDAGISKAIGLVAGTDNDSNNLSIVVTAQQIKRGQKLFTIARQNYARNSKVFAAAHLDMVMQPSSIVAREIIAIVKTPLLAEFLSLVNRQNKEWLNHLISLLIGLFESQIDSTWSMNIAKKLDNKARIFVEKNPLKIIDLMRDLNHRDQLHCCLPLMIKYKNAVSVNPYQSRLSSKGYKLLPSLEDKINFGDEILFCGDILAMKSMRILVSQQDLIQYVILGTEYQQGWLFSKKNNSNK